jgi:hypothetical protein
MRERPPNKDKGGPPHFDYDGLNVNSNNEARVGAQARPHIGRASECIIIECIDSTYTPKRRRCYDAGPFGGGHSSTAHRECFEGTYVSSW